jgi:two-component system, LytTR family, response regulator
MSVTKKINAVIIDDEELGRENLGLLIEKFCKNVQVEKKFSNELEAYEYLTKYAIDVVFLDISMPNINGFEFLQLFTIRNFEVIFVTAYEDFGIQAIRAKAIDYLTKPISVIELQEAINRVIAKQELHEKKQPKLISVSNTAGTNIINTDDIVYLEADDYITTFHLTENKKIIVSKNIKYFEDLLDKQVFIRIHKSYIVNINFIQSYSKKDGGIVTLKYPITLPISRRKLSQFIEIMSQSIDG